MQKELVVVVHGVGVREAGVSTDLVSLALHKEARRVDSAAADDPAPVWAPHASDDFHLREARRFSNGPLRRTFGARLRRYRRNAGGEVVAERVIADFYWGDIAGTGGDFLRVVTGLVKVVLGLSHAIRENAASVWPHRPWLRRTAGFAALVVHGPVFAFNLILLGGVLLSWALLSADAALADFLKRPGEVQALLGRMATLGAAGPWLLAILAAGATALARELVRVAPIAAALCGVVACMAGLGHAVWAGPVGSVGAAAVLAGAILGMRAHAFLLRHLADWIVIGGLGCLALVVLDRTLLPGGLQAISKLFEPLETLQKLNLDPKVMEVYALGGWLLWAVVLSWALSIGAALVLLVARWWRPFDRHPGASLAAVAPVDFLAAAIGLMTMLALLLLTAVWGALRSLPFAVLPDHGPVDGALVMALPALVGLVALLLVAAAQVVRARLLLRDVDCYMAGDPDTIAETARLVVARPMLRVLEGFVVLVALLSLLGVLPIARGLGLGASMQAMVALISSLSTSVVLGLAGAATLLVGALRAQLAMAIGIATDVLIYLNNYSWTSYADGTDRAARPQPARTLSEHLATDPGAVLRPLTRRPAPDLDEALLRHRLAWIGRARIAPALAPVAPPRRSAGDRIAHGYWMRRRIHARMGTLVNELLRNEAPETLCLVAHSQGTVIAIDMLAKAGPDWSAGRPLRLITMGSPYTHLYNRYFPCSFPSHHARPALLPLAQGGALTAWVNIFRTDDFIGTHIDAPRNRSGASVPRSWPRETPIGTGGHTSYWVDGRILGPLARAVAGRRDGPGGAG